MLTSKFPEANGEFIIGFKDADGNYTFSTQNLIIGDGAILNDVPEAHWNSETWGNNLNQE